MGCNPTNPVRGATDYAAIRERFRLRPVCMDVAVAVHKNLRTHWRDLKRGHPGRRFQERYERAQAVFQCSRNRLWAGIGSQRRGASLEATIEPCPMWLE